MVIKIQVEIILIRLSDLVRRRTKVALGCSTVEGVYRNLCLPTERPESSSASAIKHLRCPYLLHQMGRLAVAGPFHCGANGGPASSAGSGGEQIAERSVRGPRRPKQRGLLEEANAGALRLKGPSADLGATSALTDDQVTLQPVHHLQRTKPAPKLTQMTNIRHERQKGTLGKTRAAGGRSHFLIGSLQPGGRSSWSWQPKVERARRLWPCAAGVVVPFH